MQQPPVSSDFYATVKGTIKKNVKFSLTIGHEGKEGQ
jgi:hypothetical protein